MNSVNNNDVGISMKGIIKGIEVFAAALEKVHTRYQNNAENLSKYLLAFADFGVWSVAIDKLLENQIVFTDDLPQELANDIYSGADIEKAVSSYYFENNGRNMERLIHRCEQYEQVHKYSELYAQILSAYDMDHHLLACIGLFSLIDGVLADVSEVDTTRFETRLNIIKDKFEKDIALNEVDRKTLCIHQAFNSFGTSVFANSKFSEREPQSVNRHWDLHGRTHREHSQIDFLKVLLWLDAIMFFANKDTRQSEENN